MKAMQSIALLVFACWLQAGNFSMSPEKGDDVLRIMTFNVRYDSPSDIGDIAWAARLPRITDMLHSFWPDVLGLQEPYANQIRGMVSALGKNYAWVGESRGNTCKENNWAATKFCEARRKLCEKAPNSYTCDGEFNPIFFTISRFKQVDTGIFWLNESGKRYEKGWDSADIRICTWVKLKDTKTGTTIFVFNTHLDYESSTAQEEGLKLIIKHAKDLVGSDLYIITGDFNATFSEVAALLKELQLVDTRLVAKKVEGANGSFTGFYNHGDGSTIDYVLIPQSWYENHKDAVIRYAILERTDHAYLSDHRPVFIDIQL